MILLPEDINKHVAYQASDDVAIICKRLFETFNLNYFDYVRVYPDGSCLILVSDGDWYRHFFENKGQVSGSIVNGGIHLWATYVPKSMIEKCEKSFDHCNGITVYTQNKNYIEYFDIAAPPDNQSILEFYLNNVSLLNQFLFYFKDKAIKLINHAEKKRFIIPDCEKDNVLSIDNEAENFHVYLNKNNKCINFLGKDVAITKREYECLVLTSQGKTMKAVAQNLNISPKTVEEYLANIKNKAGYTSKLKLVDDFTKNFVDTLGLDL